MTVLTVGTQCNTPEQRNWATIQLREFFFEYMKLPMPLSARVQKFTIRLKYGHRDRVLLLHVINRPRPIRKLLPRHAAARCKSCVGITALANVHEVLRA
jgi:hypothetical protein